MIQYPEDFVIIASVISMIFAIIVFLICYKLVKMLWHKTGEERDLMAKNFKLCCC